MLLLNAVPVSFAAVSANTNRGLDVVLFPYSFLLQEYLKPLFLIDCDGEGKDIGFD